MTKPTILFATLAALAALAACTPEHRAETMPPGKYESMTKTTDDNGTTITRQEATEVDVDEEGNKTAVVKTKTTKDPKGLFNKRTTSETTKVIEER